MSFFFKSQLHNATKVLGKTFQYGRNSISITYGIIWNTFFFKVFLCVYMNIRFWRGPTLHCSYFYIRLLRHPWDININITGSQISLVRVTAVFKGSSPCTPQDIWKRQVFNYNTPEGLPLEKLSLKVVTHGRHHVLKTIIVFFLGH